LAIHRLSAAALKKIEPGMHPDGGGLYLRVSISKDGKSRNRSWIYRFSTNGKAREMGLGSTITVSLAEARRRALACRLQRLDGLDPIEERDAKRAAKVAASIRIRTFEQCANAYFAAHRDKWRSKIHASQWAVSLAKDANPIIGRLPVAAIDVAMVMKVLEPIWSKKPETASRLRGRIEAVLDWAAVSGFRQGDNPARWKGHLEHLLPPPRAIKSVEQFSAMDYRTLPAFMVELRAREGMVERALEFLVNTTSRSGEVLGALWSEIDLAARTWTIPADRMKGNREHRVPLCDRCIAVLREVSDLRQSDYVFPGSRGAAISGHMMRRLLIRMGHNGVTIHGFRASFKTWASERTAFPPELAEHALAHAVGSDVERRYNRTDLFDKRRKLMEAWAAYLTKPMPTTATVTPLARIAEAHP
jgi:integrase